MGTIFVDKIKNGGGGATVQVDEIVNISGDSDSGINLATNDNIKFNIAGSQKAVIDSSGNLFVGKTSSAFNTTGTELGASGQVTFTSDDSTTVQINRKTSNGIVLRLSKDSTSMLELGNDGNDGMIQSDGNRVGFTFGSENMTPRKNGAISDNTVDLGHPSYRFDDIFATNGTIQTSDQNEKQDIASATAKELNVAKKLSELFKTFRWKDKVAEKGDKARTHTGIIAQEVQSAFSAEGLDASDYGLFISNTWWEKEISVDAVEADEEKGIQAKDAYTYMDTKEEKTDGYTERTRLGVRYPELFSFIFSSIEARLSALEAK